MFASKPIPVCCALAMLSTGHVTPAFASSMALEEIVVTARKREESIQDIPVAVTAVTAETFDRAAISNFEEATALTPGFSTSPASFSPLVLTLSMRGSAQNSVTPTDDQSVGIYVDGVYVARPYGIGIDLLDLADVQVLKGPQGTLFGRNSTAGALLLHTNDPELEEFSGTVGGSLGNDTSKGNLVLNIPLGEKFALRAAHQTTDKEDWIDNIAQNPDNPLYTQFDTATKIYGETVLPSKTVDTKIGGYSSDLTRLKLRFTPTDTLDFVLAHEEFERDLAGPARETVWLAGADTRADLEDDSVSLGFDPRVWVDTKSDTLTMNYDTALGEFKFIAGTREYRSLNEADYDGGDLAAPYLGSSTRRHGSWGRSAGEQETYELQWVSALFNDALDVTAGVTYFEEQSWYYDYSYGGNLRNPDDQAIVTGFAAAGGNAVEIDDKALGFYIQSTYHINDVSNLTLGLRRSEDDKSAIVYGDSSTVALAQLPSWDFDAYVNNAAGYFRRGATAADLIILTPSETFSSTDWLVSYDYQLSDDVLVYAKVSTGFRAGGFNGRGVSDETLPFIFEPEELLEYELGLKGDFLDSSLRWNTALFMNETDNKQFNVLTASLGDGPPGTTTRNAGKAEAVGFETEVTYILSDNWSLSGSYAFVDTEITEMAGADCTDPLLPVVESVPDACIPAVSLVPENEWTLALNYDREFSQFRLAGTAVYHWIDTIEYATRSATDYQIALPALSVAQVQGAIDAARSDAYGTLNFNTTLSTLDDKYHLTLWCKNVLDERAVQSTVINIPGGAYQYVAATVNEPRTYGMSVKVNF